MFNNMYRNERLKDIMNLLEKNKKMHVTDMQNKLFLSQSTLRRDLIYLEKNNLIKREFGQVYLLQNSNIEFPYLYRNQSNQSKKRLICKKAANFVEDNFALFLDSSSTVYSLPDFLLKKQNLTVITNGLTLANKINTMPNIRLFFLGGSVPTYVGSSVGTETFVQIEKYHANLAIMSFGGIKGTDIYITDQDQANIRAKMIENSRKSILLLDSTKFGKQDFIKFGTLANFDILITDKKPQKRILDYASKNSIKIVY